MCVWVCVRVWVSACVSECMRAWVFCFVSAAIVICFNAFFFFFYFMRFAVGVGSSGVCMFHVLILMSILVLNCAVL